MFLFHTELWSFFTIHILILHIINNDGVGLVLCLNGVSSVIVVSVICRWIIICLFSTWLRPCDVSSADFGLEYPEKNADSLSAECSWMQYDHLVFLAHSIWYTSHRSIRRAQQVIMRWEMQEGKKWSICIKWEHQHKTRKAEEDSTNAQSQSYWICPIKLEKLSSAFCIHSTFSMNNLFGTFCHT